MARCLALLGMVATHVLDERTPVYESVARFSVDTDGRTPQEVADEVARVIEEST